MKDSRLQSSKWWEDKKNEIGELYNEEWGVGTICARETPTGWEYAGVGWRYQSATLEWILKDGKKLANSPQGTAEK